MNANRKPPAASESPIVSPVEFGTEPPIEKLTDSGPLAGSFNEGDGK